MCLKREERLALLLEKKTKSAAAGFAESVSSLGPPTRAWCANKTSINQNQPLAQKFQRNSWARGKQTSCQFMSRGGVKTSRELSLAVCHSSSSSFIWRRRKEWWLDRIKGQTIKGLADTQDFWATLSSCSRHWLMRPTSILHRRPWHLLALLFLYLLRAPIMGRQPEQHHNIIPWRLPRSHRTKKYYGGTQPTDFEWLMSASTKIKLLHATRCG